MNASQATTTTARRLLFLALLVAACAVNASAQNPCNVYVSHPDTKDTTSASVYTQAYSECTFPATWAEAHVTLPGGRHADASGNGAAYAEAYASITINNEVGQGTFSGYGATVDFCWEGDGTYEPFNYPFTIPNRTPVVTGISPSQWFAGQTTTVTFSGQYFGTNSPALSFSPSSGITYSLISHSDNATNHNSEIVANVTVSASVPDESVSVTVTNTGYGGMGFISTAGSTPASAPATATVLSLPPGTAQIDSPASKGDGETAAFHVTTQGGAPSSISWSYSAPSGSGNNPTVTFNPTTGDSTTTNAKWFALPNAACSATFSSTYTIKATVTFPQNVTNPQSSLTVSLPTIGGGTNVFLNYTGFPMLDWNPNTNQWFVANAGTLARTAPVITIYVSPNSQFYSKVVAHENKHYDQMVSGMNSDLYTVSGLMGAISSLTDATYAGLVSKVNNGIQSYAAAQDAVLQSRRTASEVEAYNVSDPIAPQYLYQNCGRYQ